MYSLYLRRLHSYYTKDLQKTNAPLLEYLTSMDIEFKLSLFKKLRVNSHSSNIE